MSFLLLMILVTGPYNGRTGLPLRGRRESRRELYYIILDPRAPGSADPTVEQRERYARWFADVAHGWDIPGGARGGPP